MATTPPLAVHVLQNVRNIEITLRDELSNMSRTTSNRYVFATERLKETVLSVGRAAFMLRADYYASLKECCIEWIESARQATVSSCAEILKEYVVEKSQRDLEYDLLASLENPVIRFKEVLQKKKAERRKPHLSTEAQNLAEKMDRAVAILDITHDAFAHRLKIGKTTYFAIKNGEGKRSNRMKVEREADSIIAADIRKRTKTN